MSQAFDRRGARDVEGHEEATGGAVAVNRKRARALYCTNNNTTH